MSGNALKRFFEKRRLTFNRGARQLRFEQLEIRQVLAVDVYITELLFEASSSVM